MEAKLPSTPTGGQRVGKYFLGEILGTGATGSYVLEFFAFFSCFLMDLAHYRT